MNAPAPPSARAVALQALERIERDGAYANLVLDKLLARSGLDARDRAFATELVYGTVRMRRACDYQVDRFLMGPVPDLRVRQALRLGAYQIAYAGVPAHAAVDASVALVPRRARGLVNAVLRRVAAAPVDSGEWPDRATRLSYPDWIVERLVDDLGECDAVAMLAAMNEPAPVTRRADGYRQDPSSQMVGDLVGARPGERVADVCAAPGGKATALATAGAWVAALDRSATRLGLVVANRDSLGLDGLEVAAGDARRPPLRHGAFDRVLVDAPCSGLGALRRRPDARWRIRADDVERLAVVQREMLEQAAKLARPGGRVVYSVCTVTRAETVEVAADVVERGLLEPTGDEPAPWRRCRLGAQVLAQDLGTDAMYVAALHRPPSGER